MNDVTASHTLAMLDADLPCRNPRFKSVGIKAVKSLMYLSQYSKSWNWQVIFSLPGCPDVLWDPSSLLVVKWLRLKDEHSFTL
jgi:molybdopterin biosynthesis enzyme MoaB